MSFLIPKPPAAIQPPDPSQAANRANNVIGAQLAAGGRNQTFLTSLANNTSARPAPTQTGLSG